MRYELPDFEWAIIRSWRLAGVWDRIMDALAAGHDPTVQMIDTSIVRWSRLGATIRGLRMQFASRSRR